MERKRRIQGGQNYDHENTWIMGTKTQEILEEINILFINKTSPSNPSLKPNCEIVESDVLNILPRQKLTLLYKMKCRNCQSCVLRRLNRVSTYGPGCFAVTDK